MAYGQVIINSLLNTDGVIRGSKEIKKELQETAKLASKTAKAIEEGLKNADYKQAFSDLPQSFKEAYAAIEVIRANDALSAEKKAAQIAEAYRKLGVDQAAASSKAWAILESDSANGSHKIIDDLKEISEQTNLLADGFEGLSDTFRTAFGANFLANLASEAFDRLGDFIKDSSKQSVEAAAAIQASNAQFEQTFKDVESTAKQALQSIADKTGITASRMQDAYTKIFAFTKTTGADTAQALDISSRAMTAAADQAAYYDRSIEDVTETLQSFLKGNYENDAALGISATETTRNAKANELYAKSFNELSESQKVDTLLAMVEAGNAASGAFGQAARESDSWTNVTGELQEAWRQLLGVLGSPVLEALIPIVQGITDRLQGLIEKTASQELRDNLEEIQKSFETAQQSLKNTGTSYDVTAAKAQYYVQRLEELEGAGLNTASAQAEYRSVVQALNDLIPGLNLEIEEQTGLITMNKDAILAEVEAMKQRAMLAATEELLTEALRARADAALAVSNAEQALVTAADDEVTLMAQLEQATGMTADEYMNLLVQTQKLSAGFTASDIPGMSETFSKYGLAIAGVNSEEMALVNSIYANRVEQERLRAEIEAGQVAVTEYGRQVSALTDTMGQMLEQSTQSMAQTSQTAQNSNSQAAETIVSQSANATDKISESTTGNAESMATNVAQSTERLASDIQGTMDSIEGDAQLTWAEIAGVAQGAVAVIQAAIDSIHGTTVFVDVVMRGGGGVLSGGLSYSPTSYTPSAAAVTPQVPYLATGAVIPPNAPFYAVLGDQKHGRNLEAPEELIRKIVREETGGPIELNATLKLDGDMAPLIRKMYPALQAEAHRKGNSLAVQSTIKK